MLRGRIVAEGLKAGAVLEVPELRLSSLSRHDVADSTTASQPDRWTFVDVEAPSSRADELAAALAAALLPEDGWYADFRLDDEHVVVFAEAVFRYRVGDAAGRQEAVDHGRAAGTPEHQLDWDD